MFRWIMRTQGGLSALILRLTLAGVIFPHGAQKALGLWGGKGISATLDGFQEHFGIPVYLGALVIATEFLGAICLALGLFGRIMALGIGVTMGVAAWMGHYQHGFFMNWFGNQDGEGFEYHLLAMGISLALVIVGSGALSIDRLASRR
jgi:putative oxidoreductase